MPKETKTTRRPRRNRRHISKRSQPSKDLHNTGIQKRKRRIGHASTRGVGFDTLLGKPVDFKSAFEIPAQKFFEHTNMLFVLKHLHKCLKKLPGYIDTKVWKTQPSPAELADHILGEIKNSIPKGFTVQIGDPNDDANLTVYYYKEESVRYGEYIPIPMEWLEEMYDDNYPLFYLITGIVQYIHKRCGIDNYITRYDDVIVGDPSAFLDYDEDDEADMAEKKMLEDDIKKYNYKNGIIHQYIEEGKEFCNYVTEQEAIERIKSIYVTGNKQKAVKKWLLLAIPLLEGEEIAISDYVFEVNFDDVRPLNLHDTFNFCWSAHSEVTKIADEYRDADWNEGGYHGPIESGAITPKKHIEPKPVSRLHPVYKFFEAGNRMYYKHFDKKLENKYANRRKNATI